MLQTRRGALGSVGVAAVMASLIGAAPPAGGATTQDGAGGTFTIYAAQCPAGYAGDASADQCDANPVAGVEFRIGLPGSDFYEFTPTDAGGLVAFEFGSVSPDGIVRVIERLPPDTERFVAYCVNNAGDPLDIIYRDNESDPDIGVVDVAVGEVGDVACDWYNVPRAIPTDTDEAAPDSGERVEVAPDDAPATASKPTGDRPVAIHSGTCGDLDADPLFELSPLVAKRGAAEGAEAATSAVASFTTLDASVSDLLANDHAVAVLSSGEARGAGDALPLAACGEIGGVRAEAGSLALGLREQNGSGVEGVAYFVPDPNEPGRTRFTVFVAERLAEED